MTTVCFPLRDVDPDVVACWQRHFAGIADVHVTRGDIFAGKADAIVSPANSFGYMDGGIDLVYRNRFGWDLQTRLQAHLKDCHDGELPVGQATIVATQDPHIRYLISAPTMRIPMNVSNTLNAYLAFRAAIRAVKQHNLDNDDAIQSVLSPGLCTAIGRMPPEVAARQMAAAYRVCVLGERVDPRRHWDLSGIE